MYGTQAHKHTHRAKDRMKKCHEEEREQKIEQKRKEGKEFSLGKENKNKKSTFYSILGCLSMSFLASSAFSLSASFFFFFVVFLFSSLALLGLFSYHVYRPATLIELPPHRAPASAEYRYHP